MNHRIRIISTLGAGLIRLLGSTWRFRVSGEEHVAAARAHGRTVVWAFWHGRMLPLSYGYRGRSIHVLASQHRDGELMGQTIRKLGFGHVRGSSTRGGAQAILELAAKLREGYDLGLTVDGPRGPKYVFKPGPLEISKLSGCAVVPVAVSSKRHWVFTSWDALELPWPFTKVSVLFGHPTVVSSAAGLDEIEQKRQQIENTLRDLTEVNDEVVCSQ